jgi:hypothetical protein
VQLIFLKVDHALGFFFLPNLVNISNKSLNEGSGPFLEYIQREPTLSFLGVLCAHLLANLGNWNNMDTKTNGWKDMEDVEVTEFEERQ